jgi:hypothetical protein
MANIQDLARWGYDKFGRSADFRKSQLWSALDPLFNSPFVPSEWKGTVEKNAEEGQKRFKNYLESSVLKFENRFGQDASEQDSTKKEDGEEQTLDILNQDSAIIVDYLSAEVLPKALPANVSIEDFKDTTRILYEVFFRE